jgi:putative hydrolase of the HAD superfamily
MTVKAIFFDAAGTLMKPARGVGESYASFAAKYGLEVSPRALAERFRICFDQAPRLAFPGAVEETVSGLEREWWKSLVTSVFEPWTPFAQFDDCFDELFAYFAAPGAWNLYPEVSETLEALKRLGLGLSVISNFDSRLLVILEGLGVASNFDQIFVSSRVGYAKPDPEIFHAALKRHGLQPEQALHVGDSEINDRLGAANAGLRGVLVDRRGTAPPRDGTRISSLIALLDLVGDRAEPA